jgi:hypothetical protein
MGMHLCTISIENVGVMTNGLITITHFIFAYACPYRRLNPKPHKTSKDCKDRARMQATLLG